METAIGIFVSIHLEQKGYFNYIEVRNIFSANKNKKWK